MGVASAHEQKKEQRQRHMTAAVLTPATLPSHAGDGDGSSSPYGLTAGDRGENKPQRAGGDPATAIRLQDILWESTDPTELKAKFTFSPNTLARGFH